MFFDADNFGFSILVGQTDDKFHIIRRMLGMNFEGVMKKFFLTEFLQLIQSFKQLMCKSNIVSCKGNTTFWTYNDTFNQTISFYSAACLVTPV
ncbi:hypothetical protein B5E66_07575 [Faecalibacterium sp. An121]|nr:hypothetical protein B5E66_07575 [Faecalibacterium sp. An121]